MEDGARMRALNKLTKSEKKEAASIRQEIAWLEEKIGSDHPMIDDVKLVRVGDKLSYTRIVGGSRTRLNNDLRKLKTRYQEIYDPNRRQQ